MRRNGMRLRITAWNSSALLHSDEWRRRRKVDEATSLIRQADVIGPQEVPGSWAELRRTFRHAQGSHEVFASLGDSHAAGGVAIFVSRSLIDVGGVDVTEVGPGRVLQVDVRGSVAFSLLVVHNFGLSLSQVRALGRRLRGMHG